jgi:hypothetical protein
MSLLKPGSFEVHAGSKENTGDGILTWTGAEMTILTWGSFDCIYKIKNPSWEPENPEVALVTGSKNRKGGTALLDLQVGWALAEGSAFCSKALEWTAYFSVTTPDYLDVD